MLNQLVAHHAAGSLQPLVGTVISRLAGLVKVLETQAFTPGRISRFPIPAEDSEANCARSGRAFPDLVPNDSEWLMVYFEDGSCLSTDGGRRWQSNLRLVEWGNASRIVTNQSAIQTPARVIASVIERLRLHVVAPIDGPVQNLACRVAGSPESGANLFSRYTYSQIQSQYLLPPYFAFGLDLQFTYTLNYDCFNALTGITAAGC